MPRSIQSSIKISSPKLSSFSKKDEKFSKVSHECRRYDDVCRVCLKEGKYYLFQFQVYYKVLSLLTGIEMHPEQTFPKQLCKDCYTLLRGAVFLRKTALNSDKVLKQHCLVKYEDEDSECNNSRTEVENCTMEESNVFETKIENCTVEEGNVSETKIEICTVEENNFPESDIENYTIGESDVSERDIENYTMGEYNVSKRDIENCTVEEINVSETEMEHCTVEESNVPQTQIQNYSVLQRNGSVSQVNYIKQEDNVYNDNNLSHLSYIEESRNPKLSRKRPKRTPKQEECPICHNTYTSIKNHMLIHSEMTYVCEKCGRKFRVKSQLKRHMMLHSNVLPFKCTYCPYKGRFKSYLQVHLRTHTGERPYQCTQCPSSFVNDSNLKRHIRDLHKKKEFQCDICLKYCSTKKILEHHLKSFIHSGIKETQCDICGKAFGSRKHVMRHQRKVHKRAKLRGRVPLYLQLLNNAENNDEEVQKLKKVH